MTILPLSLLNDYLYCPRRAGLKLLEGLRSANEHTLAGDLLHERADKPGYEQRSGWTLLRALPLFSDRLGLSGKADLVEVRKANGTIREARPVEYKKGKKKKWSNDDAQLCAQALCLEEMLGLPIPAGSIYHATSHVRREVEFTPALRSLVETTVAKLRALLASARTPPPEEKPQCRGCSLHEACLPETSGKTRLLARLRRELYHPREETTDPA